MGFINKRNEENYMDQVQQAVQETGEGPGGEEMNLTRDGVEVDRDAADLLEPEAEEPKQVESVDVIYVPHKDFEARVNDSTFYFRQDVPTKVTRDVANMLLEDRDRGYVK